MFGLMFEAPSTVRFLIRNPTLSMTVALSLALGVGILMAVLNVVDALLLRPLPYPHPDRIVEVKMSQAEKSGGVEEGRISFPDYRDWQENGRPFSDLAAISEESFVLSGAGAAERIAGARVTTGFFGVLGLQPALGTVSRESWQAPGARIAVLSHPFWESRFGKDRRILGRPLRLNDHLYTVVGVMPPGLDLPRQSAVWIPLDASDPDVGSDVRDGRYLQALARLRKGVDLAAANREMRELSRRLAGVYTENKGYVATLVPLRDELVGDFRPGLLFLSVAVSLVLLIVCINVAGVLVAHGISRSGDMWVRLALGASRGRLARLLLTENLTLALAGGGVGLLAGVAASRFLVKLYPQELGLSEALNARGALIAAGLAVTLAAGLLVSVPAMLQVAHKGLGEASKGVAGPSRASIRAQAVLLVLQIGVALTLLNAAGLMLHSTAKLLSVNPGFQAEGLLTARISLPAYRYPKPFQRAAFFKELLARLERTPGIESAAAVTNLPFSGSDMLFGFSPVGDAVRQASSGNGGPPKAHYRAVSPDYFRTLRVPLVAGRFLEPRDEAGELPVVVVNETFAHRLLPAGSPLGRQIRVMYGDKGSLRIVGVVGDLRHSGLSKEPEPEIFVPYTQQPWAFMTLVVRAEGDPKHMIALVRSEVAGLDMDQPVDRISTMEDLVAESVARPRFYGILLFVFALVALATAVVGVYGLTSHWVSLRLRDVGIHMALGASRGQIQRLFLRKPLALALVGLVLGSGSASALSRALAGLLYGVSPHDPATLAGTAAALLLAVLLAAWLPAHRASGVDPAGVLRHQ